MPPRATIRHNVPENVAWFGRASAAIEKWDPSKSALAKEHLDLFFSSGHARQTSHGLTKFLALLNQAQAGLRLETGAQHPMENMSKKIFIGHGRSSVWYQLKAFLSDRLHLACDEFNAESAAGKTTVARLQECLDQASFAFLVMTAEDIHADSSYHARENVIHEAGLFQGRLGFARAIILLEEGCAQFSNIHGLTHIGFPKGNLDPAFESIRQVLEREDVRRTASRNGEIQRVAEGDPVATQDSFEGEPCPKCFRKGWHVESSSPDRTFGELGVVNRLYKCAFCGFSENKLVK